jgi:CheY-like chemotaxis protein
VLINLLSNAVKFTHQGEICVSVRNGQHDPAGSVYFEVADSGIGVAAEKHHLLFERFSQADASTARKYGGSGLGLSIVRGLVEMMGGKTGFRSEAGKGSAFWFTAQLPVQPAFQRPRPLMLTGKRILVVDDNAAGRRVLQQMLGFWRCEAEVFSDFEAAMTRLRDDRRGGFDAAILDFEMPALSGDRFREIVRLEPRLSLTPMILLQSSREAAAPAAQGLSGFVGRVTKPIKEGELGACLAAALGYSALKSSAARDANSVVPNTKTQHRLLVVEDNVVNQQVIAGLLQHLGYSADVLSDGRSALQALTEIPYALVLTDCQMPEMDGYELSRLIRDPSSKVLNSQIPIIAVTALSLAGDRERCLSAGMDDYLSKPVRREALSEVLSRWLDGKEPPAADRAAVAVSPADGRPPVAPAVKFDAEEFIERLMGNEDLAKRVAGTFIDTMPGQLAALGSALRSLDGPAARLAAHSIKGAAANVGGVAVRDLAARLESLAESGTFDSAAEVLPELFAHFESLKPVMQKFCNG